MCMCIEPNNERATMNKKVFEDILEETRKQERQEQQSEGSGGVQKFVNKRDADVSTEFDKYERLCRGEQTHVGIHFTFAF